MTVTPSPTTVASGGIVPEASITTSLSAPATSAGVSVRRAIEVTCSGRMDTGEPAASVQVGTTSLVTTISLAPPQLTSPGSVMWVPGATSSGPGSSDGSIGGNVWPPLAPGATKRASAAVTESASLGRLSKKSMSMVLTRR